MRKNQILKNIQSLSTEGVLHDPAELFCICASRHVTVRGNDSCKIIKDPLNGAD